jgi:hypothetical protein
MNCFNTGSYVKGAVVKGGFVASFAFRGIVCALISSIFAVMICLQVDSRQPFCFESNS